MGLFSKKMPDKKTLARMGPVQSVPPADAQLKKALARREFLEQAIRENMDLASLSRNPAFLRLVNEQHAKALAALVQCQDLTHLGPALQANVLAWSEMEKKARTAAENLRQHQQQLATLEAQLRKSGESA